MLTNSFKPVLDREWAINVAKPIIDIACPAQREEVNYATGVWERCRLSVKGKVEEAIPVHILFLHVIQMVDSAEVLLSSSCVEPTNILLRSAWEARLYIEYILEKDSKRRALAWQYNRIQQEIRALESFDPTNPKGKEAMQMWAEEPFGDLAPFPSLEQLPKEIQKMKDALKKPIFFGIQGEYNKLRRSSRQVEWYSLFGGPENIRKLAKYLRVGTEYSLYRTSSGIIHAEDIAHLSLPTEDDSLVLGSVRNPLNIIGPASFALNILLEVMTMVLREYRPDELSSFSKWAITEISPVLIKLTGAQIGALKFLKEKIDDKSK